MSEEKTIVIWLPEHRTSWTNLVNALTNEQRLALYYEVMDFCDRTNEIVPHDIQKKYPIPGKSEIVELWEALIHAIPEDQR